MKLKAGWIELLGVIALISLVAFGWWFMNPLYRSEEKVHSWMLGLAPLGTTVDDALHLARERGWEIRSDREFPAEPARSHYSEVEGTRIVHLYLGGYRVVFQVDLDAFWGFDEDGKLTDLKVRKMIDAL